MHALCRFRFKRHRWIFAVKVQKWGGIRRWSSLCSHCYVHSTEPVWSRTSGYGQFLSSNFCKVPEKLLSCCLQRCLDLQVDRNLRCRMVNSEPTLVTVFQTNSDFCMQITSSERCGKTRPFFMFCVWPLPRFPHVAEVIRTISFTSTLCLNLTQHLRYHC